MRAGQVCRAKPCATCRRTARHPSLYWYFTGKRREATWRPAIAARLPPLGVGRLPCPNRLILRMQRAGFHSLPSCTARTALWTSSRFPLGIRANKAATTHAVRRSGLPLRIFENPAPTTKFETVGRLRSSLQQSLSIQRDTRDQLRLFPCPVYGWPQRTLPPNIANNIGGRELKRTDAGRRSQKSVGTRLSMRAPVDRRGICLRNFCGTQSCALWLRTPSSCSRRRAVPRRPRA
jgi:hypothetical protein